MKGIGFEKPDGKPILEPGLRARKMLELLGFPRGKRVLLVGSSEGSLARALKEQCGCSVVWLEPLPQVEASEAAVRAEGIERLVGKLDPLPFTEGAFDIVCTQFTLHSVERPFSLISESSRVLKSNGSLCLLVLNSRFKGWHSRPIPRIRWTYSERKLESMLREAGFREIEKTTLVPNLLLPSLYRGDLSVFLKFEGIPFLKSRGKFLFVLARNAR